MWRTIFSLASPFLDVLDSLIDDKEEEGNDDIEGDEEEKTDSDHGDNDYDDNNDDHDSDDLYHCCFSNNDIPLSESDDNIKEDSGVVVNEMEEDSNQCLMMSGNNLLL